MGCHFMTSLKKHIKENLRKNRTLYDLASKVIHLPTTLHELRKERYEHNQADYYIISFPKCGRTWLRLMIGKYLVGEYQLKGIPNADILELTPLSCHDENIPTIRVTHDDEPQLKTPEEIKENKRRYRKKEVIFLVRDPRDVVVSLYFQFLKREKRIKDVSLGEFIRRERGSLKSVIRFYNIWYENKDVPKDFLLVKYENLHSDIYRKNKYDELKRVLRFIGVKEIGNKILSDVVEATTFERMRKMEQKGVFSSGQKRLVPINHQDEESYKTRKGKIGGYIDNCTEEDIKYMDDLIKNELNSYYGY